MSAVPLLANPVLLLQTKLYRPHAYSDHLPRPRLTQQLNQGLRRKLTLVAAPAGYGKTTAVTQWLDTLPAQSHQIAWFSLDESDNDLILFVHYVVAAIQKQYPNHCASILAALHNPVPPPWVQLATLFLNDIVALPAALILVLDDYHFVTNEEIHQFLDRLLEHLPPSLHLVLTTRTEPPLSLPRLRVRRQMNELRTAELSFSDAETEYYFTQDNTESLTPTALAALQERSQGWIAGLYLAKLSLGYSSDEQILLTQLQANNSHIIDYLITEVLTQQPKVVQTFLLQTSILRRFCRPLCESILGDAFAINDPSFSHNQAPVPSIIDQLARHHLFTISLDDSGNWYRYHHLFQLMLTRRLQQQLRPSQINTLHKKASHWFAAEGFIDEALYHALAAEDYPFAVQLIENQRLNLLNQFDYRTLERWLSFLPETIIEQSPTLLLLTCWLTTSTYGLTPTGILQRTQQINSLLTNSTPPLAEQEQTIIQAEIAAVQGVSFIWLYDFQQALSFCQQATAALPSSHSYMRVHAVLASAISLQTLGQSDEAIHIIQKELQNAANKLSFPSLWLKGNLSPVYYMSGQLHLAVHNAQETINLLAEQSKYQSFLTGTPYRWLGACHYEWNELTTAKQYLLQVTDANPTPYLNSQLNLIWLYEVEGKTDKATQRMEALHHWATSLKRNRAINDIASLQARRLYRQGDPESALAALRKIRIVKSIENFMEESPAFTLAKVLIAHNRGRRWQEAESLLNELSVAAKEGHHIPSQIEILALQALLQQRQEHPTIALSTLKQAIELAKPNGFVRTYVDLGAPMAALLYQLLLQGVEPDYVGQLLAAFPQKQQNSRLVQPVQQADPTKLIEPLTRRELDVLLLLAEELSNKRIAQRLSISPRTVKRHTINIYQKLSVSSRHDAVQAASALGIL
ncbi:MAG: LuxR C-terminal-related transcriptional regulator [Chloroflexota bacterium]